MGRSPCCEKVGLKKGPWTTEEDQKLLAYIEENGHGSWRALPAKAGLQRCGKSCRLRWTNYLRPDIKRGKFSLQEEQTIIQLHALLGNRWSAIATHLAKRTDNEIKNYWNTHLKKRLTKMGIDPVTHKPKSDTLTSAEGHIKSSANLSHMAQWESARLEAEARLVRESKLRAPINPSSPTSTIAGTLPVQLAAPRLDMIRAWQGGWPSKLTRNGQSQSHGGINFESPTSTLSFSENNNPEETMDWKSLTKPINKDQTGTDHFIIGGSQTEPSQFSSTSVVLNANFCDGFTEMLLEKCSDEEISSSVANLAANSGNVCEDSSGGENEEEQKSYWNSILKLVNSANLSGSSPLF